MDGRCVYDPLTMNGSDDMLVNDISTFIRTIVASRFWLPGRAENQRAIRKSRDAVCLRHKVSEEFANSFPTKMTSNIWLFNVMVLKFEDQLDEKVFTGPIDHQIGRAHV